MIEHDKLERSGVSEKAKVFYRQFKLGHFDHAIAELKHAGLLQVEFTLPECDSEADEKPDCPSYARLAAHAVNEIESLTGKTVREITFGLIGDEGLCPGRIVFERND